MGPKGTLMETAETQEEEEPIQAEWKVSHLQAGS